MICLLLEGVFVGSFKFLETLHLLRRTFRLIPRILLAQQHIAKC